MANMSYCRFENTLNDLRDCLNALQEEGFDCIESRNEREAAQALYNLASKFRLAYQDAYNRKMHPEDEAGIYGDEDEDEDTL